jgi:BlaI family transcriptional regulator, penicillinase repressor
MDHLRPARVLHAIGGKAVVDQSLPDAELDVLSCLWEDEPKTAREIREALADRRPLAHASICTLLGRLESKGLVGREKAPTGKAFVYRPTVAPGKTKQRLARDLMNRVFGGNGAQLMASLFEGRRPSENEIGQLESLLEELKGSKTATKGGKKRKGRS